MTLNFTHGGNIFAVARSLGVPVEDILDFSASINPLGMPPGVKTAVTAALERAVHYPDDTAEELRERIAADDGVSPAHVTVGNGSTELIHLLPRVFRWKRALIVAPPFSEYARALERQGCEVGYFVLSPDNGFSLDTGALSRRLEEGWDALFLCNPNNPAGALLSREEVEQVSLACRQSRTFLVLDEAFIHFCPEAMSHDLLVAEPGAVVLRSLTKFYALPGLRLGYALAHPDVSRQLADLRDPWSVNVLAQVAGIAALADTDFSERSRRLVRKEREFLTDEFRFMPTLFPFPSAANYLLVDTSGMKAAEVRDKLIPRRILVRDCANFIGLGANFLRVAVRTREENLALVRALRDVTEE